MPELTAADRQALRQRRIDALRTFDLSELPDEALSFLCDYLMHPAAESKVRTLLAEIDRLFNRIDFQEHFEHVGYPDATGQTEGL